MGGSEEGEEESDDALDWGDVDDRADGDGDWVMGSRGGRSPTPERYGASRSAPPGSGRTGERDNRSEFDQSSSLQDYAYPADRRRCS